MQGGYRLYCKNKKQNQVLWIHFSTDTT